VEYTETPLAGAFLVHIKRIEDARGYFARGWCRDEFAAHHLKADMVQLNLGYSHTRGTVRGMHFQIGAHAEAKFIRCTRGAIYDVVVDLRPESPTHRQWFGVELTADNGVMLYAPEGFAHGYQTLVDGTDMYYMTSQPYAPASARGVRFDDPAFAIQWPLPVAIISDADRNWPDYRVERVRS
jgi:dTDP-4-dehydrorhamnose 3,5-epimerase